MKKFADIFNAMSEDGDDAKVALFTHPGPDPDAMGSVLGMSRLLFKKWGIKADIFMEGDYSSRRQNAAMVNVLGIDLKQMDD